ncbi:MAG: hypothetical protein B7O98_03560 [Zestosphaera tikiterensis]|uniref:histidinol-phosphate transaminase n=1 Tax=Zestosphaera tikiterensis TaxID=1973259 RepID=A0A2R7Y7Q8_9CREN|nr:MAG: hypothetical protein B7O98_03560 [Zestosphaera tikiterensis]
MKGLRLHMNESPYPPSSKSIEYLLKYAYEVNKYYVDELQQELMNELSKYVGEDVSNIDILAGSSEGLILMLTYAKVRNKRLVATHPTFHIMYRLVEEFEIPLKLIELTDDGFKLEYEELIRSSEDSVVYLINPNNPTSNILIEDPDILRKVAKKAYALFIDEAYYEFSQKTFKELIHEHENVAILRTMSKAFSLAGARFGYMLASVNFKKELNKLKAGFNVPVTTQAMALGALKDLSYALDNVRKIINTREELRKSLRSVGLKTIESHTNFVLIDVGIPCGKVSEGLKSLGIYVVCFEKIDPLKDKLSKYIRVTVGKPEEMMEFTQNLIKTIESVNPTKQ